MLIAMTLVPHLRLLSALRLNPFEVLQTEVISSLIQPNRIAGVHHKAE